MVKNLSQTLILVFTLTFIRRFIQPSLSIIGLTLPLALNAQSTFIKYLDCGLNTCNAKEAEITSSANIATLRVLIEEHQNKIHLTQFSTDGTLLSDWLFDEPVSHHLIFHKFRETRDHGFILTGNFHPNIAFGDACLAKVDAGGVLEWVRTFEGDTGLPQEYGRAVFQTANDEYLMFQSSANTTFLTRLDAGGNILWSKKIDNLYLNDAVQLSDGSLVTAMTNKADPQHYRLHAIRFDENGNVIWGWHLKSSKYLEGHKLIQLDDKSFVFDAICISSVGDTSNPVIRLDSLGNLAWAKTFRPSPSSTKVTEIALARISHGEIMIGVEAYAKNPLFLKVDQQGAILSSKKIALQFFRLADIEETPDTGFIICGKVRPGNILSTQAYLIKTDANGYAGCKDKQGSFTAKNFTGLSSQPFSLSSYNSANTSSFTTLTVSTQQEDYATLCSFNLARNHNYYNREEEKSILVFPNPFMSTVTIVLSANELFTIYIYDELGRLLSEQRSLSGKFTWSPVSNGKIFFIYAVNQEGFAYRVKLLRTE